MGRACPARLDIHRLGIGRGETGGMDDLEEWTPRHELATLFGAASPHEFHRMLVTLPAAPGDTGDTFVPWCLFHRFHEAQPEAAATTAMLLVTDRRWRTATGRLIVTDRRIGPGAQPRISICWPRRFSPPATASTGRLQRSGSTARRS